MVESNSSTPASPISSPSPRQVVESFLRLTIDQPDLKKAKLHLTKRSQDSDLAASNIPPGTIYTLGAEMADTLGRYIPVNLKSMLPANASLQDMTVPVVVVQEEGEWKIDLPGTMERLMGSATEVLGNAMSAVGDAMSQAFKTVMTAVSGVTEPPTTPAPTTFPITPPPVTRKPAPKPTAKPKPAKKSAKKIVKKLVKKSPSKKAPAKPAKKAAKKAKLPKKKLAKKPVKKAAKKKKR